MLLQPPLLSLPGEWGRFQGLPVLASAAEMLKTLGIKVIRQGGSYADDAAQEWKRWRGVPWARPSLGCEWDQSYLSGCEIRVPRPCPVSFLPCAACNSIITLCNLSTMVYNRRHGRL